ncbi:MAG: hypothetical protein ROO76_19345 [Terriglobia bacterium]|jgi:tetratricopeptide (TPR) repeat protein|nr:hypothetical protein [Terriglobia bacterium]
MWLAEILQLGRQYDRALEQIPLLIQLDPSYFIGYFIAGQIRLEQGLFEEALAELRKAAILSGNAPMVMGWLGMALAKSGDTAGARGILAALHPASAQFYILPTAFAWIHLGLGEIDQAFEWMDRAVEERDPIIIPILSYAFLDPIRSDPRFQAILKKMNLP